ncbi:MAG: ATP-binding protein [Burkholderiales bacterium]|nr:ATP-binding protein [Burkholderiales bacterium]
MPDADSITVAARMADLARLVAFVESACAARGVARADALRLAFIVEELFTNTVMHGHGGDSDAPVEACLTIAEGSARLHYSDGAPPHDPLSGFRESPATLATTLSLRPIGGLGTYLIGQLIETAAYRREGARNVLELRLPLDG